MGDDAGEKENKKLELELELKLGNLGLKVFGEKTYLKN